MAKRPTRSQADDTATAEAQLKGRRRAAPKKELGPESPTALGQTPGMMGGNAALEAPGDEEPRADPQPMGTDAFSMERDPSEEDIRARAYQMYMERGGEHGGDFEDWVRAEQELKGKR